MIEQLAQRLRQAETARTPIAPIRQELGEKAVDKAYLVQAANTKHRLAAGATLRGRKIGLTSAAVQRQLGVNEPDLGMLFADMETPSGGDVAVADMLQPRVEAEIAFVMNRDLTNEQLTHQDIFAATEYVLPCLEIVDSRIANWEIGIVDTVADNASSGRFVLGSTPRRLTDFDFLHCGMVLRENGAVKATGAGAASLGNPIEAVRWLATRIARTEHPLRAGDVILSGALGPMAPVRRGAHYNAVIAGLGAVSVNFS